MSALITTGRAIAVVYLLASAVAFFFVILTDHQEPLAGVSLTLLILPWSLFLLFLVGGVGIDSQLFSGLFVAAAIGLNTALIFSLSRRPVERRRRTSNAASREPS